MSEQKELVIAASANRQTFDTLVRQFVNKQQAITNSALQHQYLYGLYYWLQFLEWIIMGGAQVAIYFMSKEEDYKTDSGITIISVSMILVFLMRKIDATTKSKMHNQAYLTSRELSIEMETIILKHQGNINAVESSSANESLRSNESRNILNELIKDINLYAEKISTFHQGEETIPLWVKEKILTKNLSH